MKLSSWLETAAWLGRRSIDRPELSIPALGSLFLLLILPVLKFLPFEGEKTETRCYLAIGVALFSLMGWQFFFPISRSWVQKVQVALAVTFLPLVLFFRWEQFDLWMIWISLILQIAIRQPQGLHRRQFLELDFLIGWVLTLLACLIVKTLIWHPVAEEWAGAPQYGSLNLWAAALIVVLSQVSPKTVPSRIWLIIETMAVVAVFAVASFRQKFIINDYALFGGAVALVRQGGVLLWDTPSQYGFLNIFFASLIPDVTPNQAVYLANSFYIFLTSLTVWMIFRRAFGTWGGRVLAFATTFCAIFLLAGWIPHFWGPNSSPSVGGFRFLPVHLMLGWLFWNSQRESRYQSPRFLVVGTALHSLGSMWSVENLYFLTVIWLPVFGFSILRNRRNPFLLVAPVVSLAGSWAALSGLYFILYGHGVDFYAFVEFVSNHTNGYGSLLIKPDGAISAVLWIGAGLLFVALQGLSKGDPKAFLPVGSLAAVWAVTVYFVGRSHENNISNLSAVYLSGVAAALVYLRQNPGLARVEVAFKSAVLPVFVVVLATCFTNFSALGPWWQSVEKTFSQPLGEYEWESPSMTAEELNLLMSSGYQPGEPLVNHGALPALLPVAPHGHFYMPSMWLPLNPGCHVSLVAPERRSIYTQRWLDTKKAAHGWLIQPLSLALTEGLEDIGSCPMQNLKFEILPVVEKYYRQVFQRDSEHFRLQRFERIDQPPR